MDQIVRTQKQLGAVLKRRRRARDLSQGSLALLANLRQATISEIEDGKETARIDKILALVTALDLEIVIRPRTSAADKPFEGMPVEDDR